MSTRIFSIPDLFSCIIAIYSVIIRQMAKTSYQLIPPEFDISYSKALQSGDRFTIPRVGRKILFSSRAKKKGLSQKSLIPILSPVWAGLTSGERIAWDNAGLACGLTGWKLFIQDTALRLKNDLTGYTTPSTIFQSRVGRLDIQSPATSIQIAQLHPLEYFVNRKVQGTRDQYEPVQIVEQFALPLELVISHKSDLTSEGAGAFAKFYVVVYSHYQGSTLENRAEIDVALSSSWERSTILISTVKGLARGYTVFAEVFNASGSLFFDNVELNHSGQNWARDPACQDINQGFTKAFAQIPKHWVDVDVPEGSFFNSFYYN